MITKEIIQNLNWIDNNPEANPVVNETTTVITKFFKIPIYTKVLTVTHTGKYKTKSIVDSDKIGTVKGFSR